MTSRGYNIAIAAVSIAIVVVLAWPYLHGQTAAAPPDVPQSASENIIKPAKARTEPLPSRPEPTRRSVARVVQKSEGGNEILELANPKLAAPPAPVSDCNPKAEALKALAMSLRSKHPDANEFIIALDKAMGVDTARMTTGILDRSVVFSSDDLMITLMMPYETYRFFLMEAARKREPLESVSVIPGVTVYVSPSRIGSPDIIKLIVERNGVVVPPIESALAPAPFETRMGARETIHQGAVVYNCSTFAPGADITITGVPETGWLVGTGLGAVAFAEPHWSCPFRGSALTEPA